MLTIAIFTFQRTKQLNQCVLSIDCSKCDEILIFNDDENRNLKSKDLLVSNDKKKVISIYNPSDFGYKNRKTGFSFGTSYEQFEDVYFSPALSVFQEKLETGSKASASQKKKRV